MRLLAILFAVTIGAQAQWTMQSAPTTADLRGIDNVGGGVVWASGSGGTVLHTVDGGKTWLRCATPPDAEKLDFRGVQAFDAKTAIVMSSGTGDLSRLYKTSDGCATWALVFTNPDKDGFFDALRLPWNYPRHNASFLLLGDPVHEHFMLWNVNPSLPANKRIVPVSRMPSSLANETAFAASNSSLVAVDRKALQYFWIGTGGPLGANIIRTKNGGAIHGPNIELQAYSRYALTAPYLYNYSSSTAPVGENSASSGVFSIDFAYTPAHSQHLKLGTAARRKVLHDAVAVGGDYAKPDDATAVAAHSSDAGKHWNAAATQPHGYRSAVAYHPATKSWITVGPNGTDISTDDGKNWRALKPGPGDAADADMNWNALSLPFVVGPKGRIGMLNSDAMKAGSQ